MQGGRRENEASPSRLTVTTIAKTRPEEGRRWGGGGGEGDGLGAEVRGSGRDCLPVSTP